MLHSVPGSIDDAANFRLARMVRQAGLATRVPAGGLVASGGVDLFAAGVRRDAQPGACLGVHSWARGGFNGTQTANDLPRDHRLHQVYLRYYREMGVDPGVLLVHPGSRAL